MRAELGAASVTASGFLRSAYVRRGEAGVPLTGWEAA